MMLRQGLFLLPLLALAACQSPVPPDLVEPRPIAVAPTATPPERPTSLPGATAPLPQHPKIQLKFTVQPSRSTGRIRTTLDPDGSTLGPRSSECHSPLRGSISAQLTTGADGSQSLQVKQIDLQTTSEGTFVYKWSPLIGHINTTLPAGILRISDHHIPGAYVLDDDGSFQSQGNKFTVDCLGHIEGHGLILGKAVGKYESRLDIPVTELVTVSGSLTRLDEEFTLHIPSAILQDSYTIDGASLNLVFTGDITATAKVR